MHFSQTGLVDQRGVKRRRGPLRGIGLFHVIHEVEAEGSRRARVQGGENSRLSVARDFPHRIESGIPQESHGEVAALGHAAIFRGDGGLPDPFLEPMHGFVVMLVDFGVNRLDFGGVRSAGPTRGGECGCSGNGPLQKGASIERSEHRFAHYSDAAFSNASSASATEG